jgi:hypothetical protein
MLRSEEKKVDPCERPLATFNGRALRMFWFSRMDGMWCGGVGEESISLRRMVSW